MTWEQAIEKLRAGECSLVSLWGEPGRAYMALMPLQALMPGLQVVSVACEAGHFPSVGRVHPPAIRLERAMHSV